MTAYNTIAFDPSRCESCNDCDACITACSQIKSGTDDPLHSRIKIVAGLNGNLPELALCRQCGDPECTKSCPSTALTKNEQTGIIDWDKSLCIDCLLCTVGCTYGGITYNMTLKHVAK
ncbi:MAG: phenylglyoxylate dehydrogenase, partial [Sedimenticola sp.]|nr:phenylglyoxylate dehydrogenase [Sedimenticola sp.]